MKPRAPMRRQTVRRERVPKDVEAEVLIRSRRRCCLCFFWDSNSEQQPGQIAHVDHNPANNSLANLAYLCFRHHNLYDAKQTQGKNITPAEVAHAQCLLYRALNQDDKLSVLVTLRLNWDPDDYADVDVEQLASQIGTLTGGGDGVQVVSIRPGSVLVTVRLSQPQTLRLFEEFTYGNALQNSGVFDVVIEHIQESTSSSLFRQLRHALALADKRMTHNALKEVLAKYGGQARALAEYFKVDWEIIVVQSLDDVCSALESGEVPAASEDRWFLRFVYIRALRYRRHVFPTRVRLGFEATKEAIDAIRRDTEGSLPVTKSPGLTKSE